MKRQIIKIDAEKCTGCGDCITGCPEGAIQMIDGKARLVSDLFCDGLGACIGTCPVGAIDIEEREAEAYDEAKVIANIIPHGINTIKAHLTHLKAHGETTYYNQALEYLKQAGYDTASLQEAPACNCPGGNSKTLTPQSSGTSSPAVTGSELRQWPVQLHLINPGADYFDNADLLISADCVPYAYGDYHRRFLSGKIVITFCPKLDKDLDRYIDKLAEIFKTHTIKSVTIVRMEVPCCGGTEIIVQKALEKAAKMHFVKINIVSIDGKII
ncbi:MAG: 4Fe-4S ferredoxin [Candidatus Cloacimonetes bacterium HGW-Cloacimonetes-1]|nr:MAG: 4Fe-4S ferredoxin [Candidatus Cloacimonetes bacterium HGW-Cloacimonetes-1]